MMGVMATTDDWRRLARFARDRRGDLRLTQGEVSASGGPSISTLRLIEGALQPSGFRPAILRALERALQWERGSVRAVLDGGDPTPLTAGDEPARPGGSPAVAAPDPGRVARGHEVRDELEDIATGIAAEISARRRQGWPEADIFSNQFERSIWLTALASERDRILTIASLRQTRPHRNPQDSNPPVELAG